MTGIQGDGRRRVVIEGIAPEIDGGRFPAKRTVGDRVQVEADVFTDGHDSIATSVLYRREGAQAWTEVPMQPTNNDRWSATFPVTELGRYSFKVQGWVDHFETWHRDLLKRIKAESDTPLDYLIGADLLAAAGERASGADAQWLAKQAKELRTSPKTAAKSSAKARKNPRICVRSQRILCSMRRLYAIRTSALLRIGSRIAAGSRSGSCAIQLVVRVLSSFHIS